MNWQKPSIDQAIKVGIVDSLSDKNHWTRSRPARPANIDVGGLPPSRHPCFYGIHRGMYGQTDTMKPNAHQKTEL